MKTINSDRIILIKNQNIFDHIKDRVSAEKNGATVIVPHICNNINAFGAGFAGQTAQIFPEVKANFHMLGNTAKLGQTQFVTTNFNSKTRNKIIFANMIAQNKLISDNNTRPINYAALVYCMNEVRSFIKNLNHKYEYDNIEIHAAKFGSGLAGGNWNFINYLIQDIWYDQKVFIYTPKGQS